MNIAQTKCDFCGKIYDTPLHLQWGDLWKIIKQGQLGVLDFCDEICLLEFFLRERVEKSKPAA